MVTPISQKATLESVPGPDNDSATFEIIYRVEAYGGTVYLSDDPYRLPHRYETSLSAFNLWNDMLNTDATSAGVFYELQRTKSPSTSSEQNVAAVVTFTSGGGAKEVPTWKSPNAIELEAGEWTEFKLTVVRTNSGQADNDDQYRVKLVGVGWDTFSPTSLIGTGHMHVYNVSYRDETLTDWIYVD